MNKSILCTAGAMFLLGCASTTPNIDRQFGDSVRAANAKQMLNPSASNNKDPVKGMDGKAAASAMENYQKSFREPTPPSNVFTIGVSGGK